MRSGENKKGGFLHSYLFGECPLSADNEAENSSRSKKNSSIIKEESDFNGYLLQKTMSSDSVIPKVLASKPGKLSKTKSSTFISSEQSENIMYNSKVTLTLKRSKNNLSADAESNANGYLKEAMQGSP